MKQFKKLAALVLAVIMVMSLAACGGGSGSNGSTAAPNTSGNATQAPQTQAPGGSESQTQAPADEGEYTVYFYAWTNPDNMKTLLAAFDEEYEGKYHMEYVKLDDAKTLTINTALASGSQIDVMTQASSMDLRVRADEGTYEGLKQFFDKEGWTYADICGEANEATQNINGDYYAIPYCQNINMIWFNKKLFDAANEPYPEAGWTWEDFRQTAIRMTSGEGENKVYGAMMDYAGGDGDNYWDFIARQKLGPFTYYNDDFTASAFDDPAFAESLSFFYQMAVVDKCIVPYDEYSAMQYSNDTQGMIGLYSDKYAMWMAPVYGCLYTKPSYGEVPADADIGMVDVPTVDGGKTVTTVYTSTASVPSSAPNKDASWEAIKYITILHPEYFAGPKAMHPGIDLKTDEQKEFFNSIIFSDKPGVDYDMCMANMAMDRTLVSKDNTVRQGQVEMNEIVKEHTTLVFTGDESVEEALKAMKEEADEAIANSSN